MVAQATHPLNRWDTVEYQRIIRAFYDRGDVVIEFADGDHARVPAAALLGDDDVDPDWTRLRIEDFHLVAPATAGDVEIPWDVIRVHSDPEFDAHWASVVSDHRS